MKKAIHTFLPFLGLILAFIVFPSVSHASTVNTDVYGNTEEHSLTASASGYTYPNGVAIEPGDMIYGNKSFNTALVGHIGIVGPDMKVYHSTPAYSNGRVADTLSTYMSRFGSQTLVVYRYKGHVQGAFPQRLQAAQWAKNNYSRITSYNVTSLRLGVVETNYCSKFVWQAYYLGANGAHIDAPIRGNLYYTDSSVTIIVPNDLINKADSTMDEVTKFSAS